MFHGNNQGYKSGDVIVELMIEILERIVAELAWPNDEVGAKIIKNYSIRIVDEINEKQSVEGVFEEQRVTLFEVQGKL